MILIVIAGANFGDYQVSCEAQGKSGSNQCNNKDRLHEENGFLSETGEIKFQL